MGLLAIFDLDVLGDRTGDKSYHEIKFAWYFPKAGWLGSIPISIYLLLGIESSRGLDRDAQFGLQLIQDTLWVLWTIPPILGMSVLEIGHNRLMKNRAAAIEAKARLLDPIQH